MGPVPWALATSDGIPVKTNKAKLMHKLELESHRAAIPDEPAAYIIDGNAMFKAQASLPKTFGELNGSLFGQLPKVKPVDFVTDRYKTESVKAPERGRRGTSKPHLIKDALTRIPRDWKAFLSCSENKQSLTHFLLKEWRQAKYAQMWQDQDRELFFVCEDECHHSYWAYPPLPTYC